MTQQHPQPDMTLAAQVISERTLEELRLDLQNTMLSAEILQAVETAITEREADTRLHDQARYIIGERWRKSFYQIIAEMEMTRNELRDLQKTEQYEMQVWAEYGRTLYLYCKHPRKVTCIKHIKDFFGITSEKALEILGNGWKAPEPVQLTFLEI